MHAKSGLRVVLKWKIYRPDSVITDVIRFMTQKLTLTTLETPDQKKPDVQEFDLEADNSLFVILTMFGNGLFVEASVTGSSCDAIRSFIALINRGGYFQDKRDRRINCRL